MTITGVEQLGGHSLLYGTLPGAGGKDGPRITAQVAGQVSTRIGDTATVYALADTAPPLSTADGETVVR